jgi:hypothetical protein
MRARRGLPTTSASGSLPTRSPRRELPPGPGAVVRVRPHQRLQRLEEERGRRQGVVVAADGTISKQVTGLAWRQRVSAQLFEEAAVDLGRALSAYWSAKQGKSAGRQIGFPRRKRKGRCRDSFRLRNKRQHNQYLIRVGEGHPRSVTLPKIGRVRVHDDTRRLRRLLRQRAQVDPVTGEQRVTPRAKILFATIARRGTRWYVSLNVHAPDFQPERRHQPCSGHGRQVRRGGPGSYRLRRRSEVGQDRSRPLACEQPAHLPASPATALLPRLVTYAPRLQQPRQGCQAASARIRPDRRCPPKLPSRGLKPAGQEPRPVGNRGPCRPQPAPQYSPCPLRRRRRLVGVDPPARLQGRRVWHGTSDL